MSGSRTLNRPKDVNIVDKIPIVPKTIHGNDLLILFIRRNIEIENNEPSEINPIKYFNLKHIGFVNLTDVGCVYRLMKVRY
ncbi:protein of unknown function [Candidatus Nitrosotalea okcheonensis]|uniref:Uncharacterized protein n=1 Tax=Candidatus Nitrosotalea okcheonensis TaxID=1903276 RepID=A0A2H1FHQ7_9ARCH|nr:protein of unknown function [Candidatus Nitrosotalea okcheonensis]